MATLLIVEDDPALLEAMSEILALSGHDVRSAETAEVGLKLLSEKSPELVVADVVMPGMSGVELAEKIRADKRWQNIPIVFASASTTTRHEGRIAALEKATFLRKPFSAETLLTAVESALKMA